MTVFEAGDLVVLKSGSNKPKTVESVYGDDVSCVWDDEKGHQQKAVYKSATLNKYDPEDDCFGFSMG